MELPGKDGSSVRLEVHTSTNSEQLRDGRVVIARDITDRLHRIEAEKAVLAAHVAREKDEEANRFTRHEVKNSVLSALTQCELLRAHHDGACGASGELVQQPQVYTQQFGSLLGRLRTGLQETLETVVSQAMAREVVHGVYVCRTVPVRVDEVLLRAGGDAMLAERARFPLTTSPQVLPVVDVDPRLLLHVHRNAVSNAAKYGKKGGYEKGGRKGRHQYDHWDGKGWS